MFDTIFIKTFNLVGCRNTLSKDLYIKKTNKKKHKLVHTFENKYLGYRYKIIHYYNDEKQIRKTVNKLKKGHYTEEIGFNKIKYEYNKDGLLKRMRFHLEEFHYKRNDFLILLFEYR